MKNQVINACIGICLLIIYGCASIGSPDGGPRDLEPPKLVMSNPKNGTTNVNPEKIVLVFDEAIQAPDLARQLLIAPFTDNTYKTKIKDGTVELTFAKPWQENTTYSLNFRKSITDITEKNAAKGVVLTFSTGNFLDSGQVSGKVSYVFNATPPKEASVLLYPASDTGQVKRGKPLYVTQTDSSGVFQFNYVKRGNYYIYALTEINNNLQYDNEKEAIAFTQDSIAIEPTVTDVDLKLHYQDKTKPIALSRKSYADAYDIEYTEGIARVSINKINPENTTELKWLLVNSGKTLRLFPNSADENRWLIEAQDSAGNTKIDTVGIRLAGNRLGRSIKSFQISNGTSIVPGDTLKLRFEVPATLVNTEGAVTIIADSATTITTKSAEQLKFNQDQTELSILMPLTAAKEMKVQIDTTKIVPFSGLPFNASTQTIQVADRANVGSLKINLKTEETSFNVQLLKDNKIVRETRNKKTVKWDNLQPGTYQVRILVDKNNNGVWDNGDLAKRQLPEPVILHPAKFEIRSNWEIVEDNPISF